MLTIKVSIPNTLVAQFCKVLSVTNHVYSWLSELKHQLPISLIAPQYDMHSSTSAFELASPYGRDYGVPKPKRLLTLADNQSHSRHLQHGNACSIGLKHKQKLLSTTKETTTE